MASCGVVAVQDLTVRFGKIVACDGVTVRLNNGVVGLLGPNGAGKTTFLSVLCGDRRPHAGQVRVNGHDIRTAVGRRSVRGAVGYLPQRFDLAGGMTVSDVVRYAAWCNGVDRPRLSAATAYALSVVELSENARQRVRHLSGGQRQRLGLAASLAHRPRLLLLDEPTAGLDPDQRIHFRRCVTQLSASTTVVLATHLLEDVRHAAQRLLIFNRGRIAFDDAPSGLIALGRRFEHATSEDPYERGYQAAVSSPGERV